MSQRADLIEMFAEAVDKDHSFQAVMAHSHAEQLLYAEGRNVTGFNMIRRLVTDAQTEATTLPERKEMLQCAFELFRRELRNDLSQPRKPLLFVVSRSRE